MTMTTFKRFAVAAVMGAGLLGAAGGARACDPAGSLKGAGWGRPPCRCLPPAPKPVPRGPVNARCPITRGATDPQVTAVFRAYKVAFSSAEARDVWDLLSDRAKQQRLDAVLPAPAPRPRKFDPLPGKLPPTILK